MYREQILLPAPRNSIEGILNLFETTDCQVLLRSSATKVNHIRSRRDMKVITIPEQDEWLSESDNTVRKYPYHKTFEDARYDPAIVLHTSGSTGLPKPITWTHGAICSVDNHHLLSPLDGFDALIVAFKGRSRIFSALPPFHAAGLGSTLFIPLYFGPSTVIPPATQPVSADLLIDLLDNASIDVCFMAPSILQDICDSPSMLKKLERIKYLVFGGG